MALQVGLVGTVSSVEVVVVPALLPAPTGLNATAQDYDVLLMWEAVVDPNLMGYHVYRSEIPGGPYDRITDPSVPPHTGATYLDRNAGAICASCPTKTYHYVVTAYDADVLESPYSGEVSIFLPQQGIPTKPSAGFAAYLVSCAILPVAVGLALGLYLLTKERLEE